MKTNRLLKSSVLSGALTIVFITALTIAGELYKVEGVQGGMVNPIKDLLKALHGHHWVGKGIWAIAFFLFSWVIFYSVTKDVESDGKLSSYITLISYALITGTLLFYGFFTFEYFGAH
jgi:hypothetical protein